MTNNKLLIQSPKTATHVNRTEPLGNRPLSYKESPAIIYENLKPTLKVMSSKLLSPSSLTFILAIFIIVYVS